MMNWDKLISAKRLGLEHRLVDGEIARSQFQRDYDRLIFSSPFRRLQNKTQVFPLPGSVFVHNRLTHSLEVASVGRTLGSALAHELSQRDDIQNKHLMPEIGAIVSTACLAHDMGNPPFGHSGEKALSEFFSKGKGKEIQSRVTKEQWLDLNNFEGNANAFRMLTHQLKGRRKGGYALTYTSIASLIKYPFGSDAMGKKNKFGFFETERETYLKIANELHLIQKSDSPAEFVRHPLVYLVEAADDISYLVMDVEDAHKLKILSTEQTHQILCAFFRPIEDQYVFDGMRKVFEEVSDVNERVAYLRAMVINKLAQEAIQIFLDNENEILKGEFQKSLVDHLPPHLNEAMESCRDLSFQKIYKHPSVVKIELAGHNILGGLLDEFVGAILDPDSYYSNNLLSLLPEQFDVRQDELYFNLRSVLDFVSGMTDIYALDLYRKIKGIGMDSYV
ncbi:MAG: deoxyguanosinetriphosphate triphosphohydrolase [Bacteroidales bacterium]|nr:deoxyguanosinetriphosphate triphosphohydrolase [Bacteroidales bacterium]